MRLATPFALLSILFLTAGPTYAAPEDDYVALMTAIEIDEACVALKYMESNAVRGIAYTYLERTSQYSQSRDGRLSADEYDAWRAGLDEKARTTAQTAGCTQQAMSYVLTAKAAAAEELYRGLLLAFHFDALPEDDFNRLPLDEHKKKSAMGYEAYLRQLYGQNFEAFALRQREVVTQMLPVDMGLSTWTWSADPEGDVANIWNLQLTAGSTMTAVQFEVTAEANGYFVRPYRVTNTMIVPALQRPGVENALPIIRGPIYQMIEDGGQLLELYSVAAVLPDRRLGLMFFGDTASRKLQSPTIRLYVTQPPYPEGMNGYAIFDDPSFRDRALVFEGSRASESCLGAPCYDFPAEATDALVSSPLGDYAELFVSLAPDDEPVPVGELGRERFNNQWLLWWADRQQGQ